MSSTTPSVTVWNRLEPRPRSRSVLGSLRADVRDPLWFLTRQWQVGEFQGEDAGSPAFARYQATSSELTAWGPTAPNAIPSTPLEGGRPLERQALAEPFAPTLTVRVELGQSFEALLEARLGDATATARIVRALRSAPGLALTAPSDDAFDPLDDATKQFLLICAGRALDGSALLSLASAGTIPSGVAENAAEEQSIRDALADLVGWVESVYGSLGSADPDAWRPELIEYGVTVAGATPENGRATLTATPDARGEFQWSSFDVVTRDATPVRAPQTVAETIIPGNVRFPGMPSPRFWDFESSELSFSDLKLDKRDLVKALCADFMLIHGVDWFAFELAQPTGTLSRIDSLVVTDVFGGRTLVERADAGASGPGATRWTMFSNTQPVTAAAPSGLADFFVVPPSAGPSLSSGPNLEEVRFARDEMANMAFGVERVTMSPLGGPRRGVERDAAVDERAPVATPPSEDTQSPLRYLIESKVPVQYIPLVAVPVSPGSATDPSIVLEKAGILRPKADGTYDVVLATGRILNPESVGTSEPYRILEEQVPRSGVTVRRTVFRSRWRDGSTHVWIARRAQTGEGEVQAGLQFDAALRPNR
jgi:hypothetical protein